MRTINFRHQQAVNDELPALTCEDSGSKSTNTVFNHSFRSSSSEIGKTSISNNNRFKTFQIFRWWWEIGAIFLSLTFTFFIFLILFWMNHKSIEKWKLPLQINSLIAVFSTLTKSAVLVALAGGLSQLKWNHFEKRGRTLDHLQYFDDASRGPWGSAMLFARLRKSNFSPIASVGAGLTVFALALEPFTQQIIEFSTRSVVLRNVTVSVYSASELVSDESQVLTRAQNIVHMAPQSNVISTRDTSNRPACLAHKCHFPAYWSLASCMYCGDESPGAFRFTVDYTLYYPNSTCHLQSERSPNFQTFKTLVSSILPKVPANCPVASKAWVSPKGGKIPFAKAYFREMGRLSSELLVEEFEFGHDDETIHTTFDAGDINEVNFAAVTSEFMNLFSMRPSPPLPSLDNLTNWGGSKFQMRRCRLSLCGRHAKAMIVEGDQIQQESPSYVQLNVSKTDSRVDPKVLLDLIPQGSSSAPMFRIQSGILKVLIVEGRSMHESPVSKALENSVAKAFMGYGKELANLDALFNISNAVANAYIIGNSNTKATELFGEAYGIETFVVVRWLWATLPVSIVLLSFVFLITTILESGTKQQRYKMSVLTGYFNGLEGWGEEEIESVRKSIQCHEREDTLVEQGKTFKAKLMRNTNGDLKFIKVE